VLTGPAGGLRGRYTFTFVSALSPRP